MSAYVTPKIRGLHSPSIPVHWLLSALIIGAPPLLFGLANTLGIAPAVGIYTHAKPISPAESLATPSAEEGKAPSAPPTALIPTSEALTPQLHAALEHIARRYRVSPEALRPIFYAVQLTGKERNVDPLLLVAIIGIESGFNPFSESAMGAIGLMQVVPRFHQDKLPAGAENSHFLDPVTNVRVGTHVLQESIRRSGGLIPGLQQFGGAIDDQELTYSNKVLAEKERIEQAVRRNGGTRA